MGFPFPEAGFRKFLVTGQDIPGRQMNFSSYFDLQGITIYLNVIYSNPVRNPA